MPRTIDDGIPLRSAKSLRVPLIPIAVGVAVLFLLASGTIIVIVYQGWKVRPSSVVEGGTAPSEPVKSRITEPSKGTLSASREGMNWSVEEFARWLKDNGRIASWEKSGSEALMVAKDGRVIRLMRHEGAIAAELAIKPVSITEDYDPPTERRISWGRFSTGCNRVSGVGQALNPA
jgi:hypothetical protein